MPDPERQMKTILGIPARLAMLTMLMLIAFFAGCTRSHVPVPEKPTAYSQEKMQAAEHWRDIAVDIADKIRDALVERSDLTMKPLYVAQPDSRPFMLAFHQLVKSELVSRAVQVSERLEQDTVLVEYDVLTVRHNSPPRTVYSPIADLGGAVAGIFTGSASTSDNEVVVNVRMAHDNRYVVHRSFIRYINDADWAHYLNTESLNPGSGGNRVVRITNR